MMGIVIVILAAGAVTGAAWYFIFLEKERKTLNQLQQMIDEAAEGNLRRTEVSEQKLSAVENSLKRYLDDSILSNAEKQKQKDRIQSLISDISHQTLTPISNLKIYGEILLEECQGQKEVVETILEQTEKLEFLVGSLVKLSRMENGIITAHPEQQELLPLFQNMRREYDSKAKGKALTLHICETNLKAIYDLKWTTEAIGNIIDNAIKYTPKGGHVEVRCEQSTFFVRIDIEDNGMGIEQGEMPNIFKRFYRSFAVADEPGVGIGLYLAREIIQAQKGYIKVDSQTGRGSVFSVFLAS